MAMPPVASVPEVSKHDTNMKALAELVELLTSLSEKGIDPKSLYAAIDKPPPRLGIHDDEAFTDEAVFIEHNDNHRYACGQCKKVLPNPYLLDLHIRENHDSFFSAMAERKPSYCCFVEECTEKFSTPTDRLEHGVLVHKLPKDFRFDCRPKNKKKTNKPKNKSKDEFVDLSMEIDKGPEKKIHELHKKNPLFGHPISKHGGQKKRIDIDGVMKDLKDSLPDEN
ncbi:protein lethal(2)k10201-like [Manduca sexta]|uniref:protein lethal(2)k10201-like n=1 Tax=Manduca sexta TaxID=7130 RepID=UPI00188E64C5|nr:protein lethal(2)k10201-like [Manduca sexta]XP_037292834.1 protein lethal(2)k10201-like [Manduca sexta]